MTASASTPQPPASSSKMTLAQRRKLFVVAAERGLSLDDLRERTPAGSVSALTLAQAHELIDALLHNRPPNYAERSAVSSQRSAAPRRPRAAKGVIRLPTKEQMDYRDDLIQQLADHYGKTVRQVEDWLATKHYDHGGPMHLVASSRDCVDSVELLKAVLTKAARAQRRRRVGHTHHEPDPSQASDAPVGALAEG